MAIRASIALAVLAALIVLVPAYPLAQDEEPRVRCGEKYMTLFITGGDSFVQYAGPLTIRKADVRAIYVVPGEALTMFIDIGRAVLRPTIARETFRSVVECLD